MADCHFAVACHYFAVAVCHFAVAYHTLQWHVTLLCQVTYFSHPQCCICISHFCKQYMMEELMKQSDMNLLKLTCNLQTVQPTRIFQYQHCLLRQIYTCYNMADLWLCHNNIVYIYMCEVCIVECMHTHNLYILALHICAVCWNTMCFCTSSVK